jgi:integrase
MTYRTPDGKRHRASTEQHYHDDAKTVRDRLAGDLASGRPVAAPGKTTLTQLGELIIADYKTRKQRSLGRVKGALKPLTAYFGRQPVVSISWGDTVKYRQHREGHGLAMASINYELAVLRRMLRLAVKDGKLATVPIVETPDPQNARAGFFTREELDRIVAAVPEGGDVAGLSETSAALARVAFFTGWRVRSELLPLTWDRVDFTAGVLRLDPNTTKNGEGREFPFGAWPELVELLKGRRAATDAVIRETGKRVPWVFHEHGRPVRYKELLTAWRAACTAAEVEGKLLHDLRRSAVRNLERAGVSRSVAMQLTGHKTESVYKRYAITPDRDLREGVAKLAASPGVTVESHSGVAKPSGER